MSFLSTLNDEQIALLGCVGALFVSGMLMSLSHYIGSARGYRPNVADGSSLVLQPARVKDGNSKRNDPSRRNAA